MNQGHNVFLQLLCETGIIGFALFLVINLYYLKFIFTTNYRVLNFWKMKEQFFRPHTYDLFRKSSIGFACFYYLFWISGNPLYDFTFVYSWVYSILICVALRDQLKQQSFIDNSGRGI